MKTILVTGGAGYIGSVLCGELLNTGYKVVCLDRFFFGKDSIKHYLNDANFSIIQKDIRDIDTKDFNNIEIVIDLAGISNDPACDLDSNLTIDINLNGVLNIVKKAKEAGISRYIFSSSCSIYGAGLKEQLDEESELNPISLYAKLKIDAEKEIKALTDKNFCVTFLRNATIYGVSRRMRFDLILNIMTMHAIKNKRIIVLGGGKQWRPLVHVRDVAKAYIVVLESDKKIINGEVFNVGATHQNFQVEQIAQMIQQEIPMTEIIIAPDDADKRDYNINFNKIKKVLNFDAKYDLIYGIREVKNAILNGEIDPNDLRTSTVKYYKYLIEANKILNNIKINGVLF